MKKIGILFLFFAFVLIGCSQPKNTMIKITVVDELNAENNRVMEVKPNDKVHINSLPSTEDYRFCGWFYEMDGREVGVDQLFRATQDLTIYAKWEKISSFVITIFDEQFPNNNQTVRVQENDLFTLTLTEPYAYRFAGWKNQDGSQYDITSPVTKNMTLSPIWTKMTQSEILDQYIDTLMDSTRSYIPAWNKESFKGRWNYIDGVFLNSLVQLYEQTKEVKYKDFLLNYINYYINENGDFINPKTKLAEGYKSGELDSVCESRILFDAYAYTKDERYLKAIERTYQELTSMTRASGSNNFCHKEVYANQIWLDGMYMYVPFYARYANLKQDNTIFQEIKEQYTYIRNHMFDDNKKLYYHGHDTTKSIFWANIETGNSASFWLRSIGWYLVSLVDVLEYFPEGENKAYLKGLLQEAVDGILPYQDAETKMFYQVVDLGSTKVTVPSFYLEALKNSLYNPTQDYVQIENYVEASGSSMISYVLLKGSLKGYLGVEYYTKGQDIFNGIYNHSFKENELHDICITAGLGPQTNMVRDGSVYYYLAEPVGSNDAKGVGPFLMAYVASKQSIEKN